MIRFKSEIDFDGAEVTRSYLDRIDIEALLKVNNKPVGKQICSACWEGNSTVTENAYAKQIFFL